MTYNSQSQRSYETRSLGEHYAAEEASEVLWGAYEAFFDSLTPEQKFERVCDWMDASKTATGRVQHYSPGSEFISPVATVSFDPMDAFNDWSFDRWQRGAA